jgi:hypothetical protein
MLSLKRRVFKRRYDIFPSGINHSFSYFSLSWFFVIAVCTTSGKYTQKD